MSSESTMKKLQELNEIVDSLTAEEKKDPRIQKHLEFLAPLLKDKQEI